MESLQAGQYARTGRAVGSEVRSYKKVDRLLVLAHRSSQDAGLRRRGFRTPDAIPTSQASHPTSVHRAPDVLYCPIAWPGPPPPCLTAQTPTGSRALTGLSTVSPRSRREGTILSCRPVPAIVTTRHADAGGAFAMGAIGGSVWHGFRGARNAPAGNRVPHAMDAIRARAPPLGGE
jgi:hypothetical protein